MRQISVCVGLAVTWFVLAMPAMAQDDDDQAEVLALYKQAEKLNAVGKTKEATQIYEKAVSKARTAFGQNHTATATLMVNLAGLYRDIRQYAKAEPLYKHSLEIYE